MVDFEKHREQSLLDMYRTGGVAAGGLTVRDYFAAKAMQVYLQATIGQTVDCVNISDNAYLMADAMIRERDCKEPNTMTVEEAFGL